MGHGLHGLGELVSRACVERIGKLLKRLQLLNGRLELYMDLVELNKRRLIEMTSYTAIDIVDSSQSCARHKLLLNFIVVS